MRCHYHKWKAEEIDYIQSLMKDHNVGDATKKINERFNLNLSIQAVASICFRYEINIDVHREVKTKFKKGRPSTNSRPVGSERICRGFVVVKIAEPSVWEQKHRVIWEKANGPIPPDHMVIFLDNDRRNFSIDNLAIASKGELLAMVRNHYTRQPKSIKPSVIALSRLEYALCKASKP